MSKRNKKIQTKVATAVIGVVLLAYSTEVRGDVFADFSALHPLTDRATGQLSGVTFTLESTRMIPMDCCGDGGVVTNGTTDGTSILFDSTNFVPSLVVGDNIALGAASDFRLSFSQPVANLSMHFYQLANNKLSFTQSNGVPVGFVLLSSDGYITVLDGGTSLRGRDGFDNASGSILIPGTISELRWTSDDANTGDGYHLQMSVDGVARADLRSSIRVACVNVCWHGSTNWLYQVQYSSELTSNQWLNLGMPVQGAGTNCITDPVGGTERRFYRVIDTQ